VRILILGGDGYLGWPTALHLSDAGHEVGIVDDLSRRRIDRELGTESLVPIQGINARHDAWYDVSGHELRWFNAAVDTGGELVYELQEFQPDAVIHLAEQRSAPYSMLDSWHAAYTQRRNVIGTLNLIHAVAEVNPDIHIVKLGSLGEYGTPNLDIEEGWLNVEHNGRRDRVLYPKRPGSWYHLSKVHDSNNLEFACRTWGLRVTDLNQGIVYGTHTEQTLRDPALETRYDYDEFFGTALNRFAVQAALGEPLTVYGDGTQVRGFIDLRDSVRCLELACLHPAGRGEFRVFNQLTETFSILEIAQHVAAVTGATVRHLPNPRVEEQSHRYRVTRTGLKELGLEPHLLNALVINVLVERAKRHLSRVNPDVIQPTVSWHRQ